MKEKLLLKLAKFSLYGLVLQTLFVGVLMASDANAQRKQLNVNKVFVTFHLQDASLLEVFNTIEAKTDFVFNYDDHIINNKSKISVIGKKSIADILIQVSEVAGVKFDQINNIFNVERLNNKYEEANQPAIIMQTHTVSGSIISNDDGEPLVGVSIIVKGTTQGTVSDINGKYSIEVPSGESVLVFSFVGYQAQEIQVGNQTVINITLKSDVTALSEIVVIGYGIQKRTAVTGAVASVDSKEISALAVPSVESALQGRVAGVNVTTNGSPGADPIVRIRGIGSITGSSDPLYVVDGLPLTSLNSASALNSTSGLNSFDPKDIESVEVLKDAAAASIYGSRAANGVIIITTKTGSRNKGMSVNVESYYGVQQAWKQLDLLKRDQYIQYGTELLTNAGSTLPLRFSNLNEPIYEGATQTYAETETNWQDEVFRSAPIYQVQASVASTTDKTKLYASAGVYGQDGIMIGTNYKRYNFRLNSEVNISDHISFGQTMTVASDWRTNLQESGGRTILQHVIHQVPYMPVYDPTKLGGYRTADNNDGSDPENPVRIQEMDLNRTTGARMFGTAYLNINILPSLTYKFTFGGDYYSSKNIVDQPIYNDGFGARTTHNLQDNRITEFSPLYQNQLTFNKQFGRHTINVTAVAERQDHKFSGLNASSQQSSNIITSLQAGQNQTIGFNDTYETTLISYLGRLNYEFAGKYLLSASIRRDGFSGFAPGQKWGNFPGISVGWRISEESFMNALSSISELKLRASYGELGVNNVGPFDWQSLISINTTYPFNNTNQGGSYFNSLPNSELTWETTKMTNYGIDLGLWEGKVTVTAEYFQRKVDDLLLDVPLAPSMGYSVDFKGNVGKMENSGFELQAGYHKIAGDFTFDLSANLGTVKNKVTDLYVPGNTIYKGSNADFGGYDITKTEAGQSVQGFYGWVVEGLFQSEADIIGSDNRPNAAVQNLPLNEDGTVDMDQYNNPANKGQYTRPGDIRFKDLDGNGVINSDDRTYLGSFLPDFNYGLNLGANYKNFDLTLFIQGVQGNEVYNGTKVLSQGMLRLFGAETAVLDAWTTQNTNTSVPRAVNGDPNQNSRTSDRFVENGSYMRIKNLSFGYSLPAGFLNSFANGSIQKFRIYVSFQNLLTITDYTGYDPEIGARTINDLVQGIDYGQYPQPRSIMGGIQLSF